MLPGWDQAWLAVPAEEPPEAALAEPPAQAERPLAGLREGAQRPA